MLVELKGNILAVFSDGIVPQNSANHGKGKGFLYSINHKMIFESREHGPLIRLQPIQLNICHNFSILTNPGKILYDQNKQPSAVNGSIEDHKNLLNGAACEVKCL